MPARSKSQQKAMGIALAVKRGEAKAKPGSPSSEMAKSMTTKQIRDFAKTKQSKLPERKKQ